MRADRVRHPVVVQPVATPVCGGAGQREGVSRGIVGVVQRAHRGHVGPEPTEDVMHPLVRAAGVQPVGEQPGRPVAEGRHVVADASGREGPLVGQSTQGVIGVADPNSVGIGPGGERSDPPSPAQAEGEGQQQDPGDNGHSSAKACRSRPEGGRGKPGDPLVTPDPSDVPPRPRELG